MTKIKAGHIGWGKGFLLSFGCYQKNEIGPDPDPDQIPAGTCGNQYVIAGMKPLPIYSPGLKIIFSYNYSNLVESYKIWFSGYPGLYQPNLNCYWYMTTTPKTVIHLLFTMIDIEQAYDCVADGLGKSLRSKIF